MPQRARRGRLPRTTVLPRSLAFRAAATAVAGAAVLAMPAAAQASAAAPAPTLVPCSSSALISAIRNANSAGTATLQLARGCDYVLTRTVAEDDGLPPVTGNIVIAGGGATTISHGRGAGLFRILEVSRGGALTLVNVTVANGQLAGTDGFDDEGGGILDGGTLVLRDVTLTGNSSRDGFGGGLFVDGGAHATVSDSKLDGNSASSGGFGGAIFNVGDLAVDGSVLTRNTADHGGGIQNQGTLTLRGGLVTFNRAAQDGGGIGNSGAGTVTLRSTVVTANTPDNCHPQGTIAGCRN
jgi:hypothetical protein